MHWVLMAPPTLCLYRLVQPVYSWVRVTTLNYWTIYLDGDKSQLFMLWTLLYLVMKIERLRVQTKWSHMKNKYMFNVFMFFFSYMSWQAYQFLHQYMFKPAEDNIYSLMLSRLLMFLHEAKTPWTKFMTNIRNYYFNPFTIGILGSSDNEAVVAIPSISKGWKPPKKKTMSCQTATYDQKCFVSDALRNTDWSEM